MLSHASFRLAIRNLTFRKNAPVNEIERKFLSDELEMRNAADIEFLRAHRIGEKKKGETRPVIARFLRFPERKLVFRRVRELADDIGIHVYADSPKEISERRKSSGHGLTKKERSERLLSLANQNLINYLSMDNLFLYTQFILIELFMLFIRLFL